MIVEETIVNNILIKTVTVETTDLSTSEQKSEWQSICSTCHHKINDSCAACSCLLVNIMLYNNSTCPIDKW